MIKNAFEAFRSDTAEALLGTLDEDTRHALPEMLRVELETQNRS